MPADRQHDYADGLPGPASREMFREIRDELREMRDANGRTAAKVELINERTERMESTLNGTVGRVEAIEDRHVAEDASLGTIEQRRPLFDAWRREFRLRKRIGVLGWGGLGVAVGIGVQGAIDWLKRQFS